MPSARGRHRGNRIRRRVFPEPECADRTREQDIPMWECGNPAQGQDFPM